MKPPPEHEARAIGQEDHDVVQLQIPGFAVVDRLVSRLHRDVVTQFCLHRAKRWNVRWIGDNHHGNVLPPQHAAAVCERDMKNTPVLGRCRGKFELLHNAVVAWKRQSHFGRRPVIEPDFQPRVWKAPFAGHHRELDPRALPSRQEQPVVRHKDRTEIDGVDPVIRAGSGVRLDQRPLDLLPGHFGNSPVSLAPGGQRHFIGNSAQFDASEED